MQNYVFLSYSRTDNAMMQRVKESLSRAGMAVWTDEGIKPGTPSWTQTIATAIQNSSCLVCLVSPDAVKSEWVGEELHFAKRIGKPIYLLLIRGTREETVMFGFTVMQDIDIRDDYSNIHRLIEALNETMETQASAEKAVFLPPRVPTVLPQPFSWCEVTAGEAKLASGGYVPEAGQTIFVDRFYMSKYPITNAQFKAFVEADGYKKKQYWTSVGWQYRLKKGWKQPRFWHDTNFNGDDQPVVGVSWFEAIAFTRWLTDIIAHDPAMAQRPVLLPTEAQWQRAVQGDDFLPYPWGTTFDKKMTNAEHSGNKCTTAVTRYPKAASPFGVMDMIGNTWEWTLTCWQDGRSEIDGDAFRVLRGGSFSDYMLSSYSVSRFNNEPPNCRYNENGFRVCIR